MRKSPSLVELKAKRDRGEPLTRQEAFRLLAHEAAKRYYANDKWSTWELKFKSFLEEHGLLEDKDWVHNYPIYNPKTNHFYECDFLFWAKGKKKAKVIELNPKIWHTSLGPKTIEKDMQKKAFLESLGIKVITLGSEFKLEDAKSRQKVFKLLN